MMVNCVYKNIVFIKNDGFSVLRVPGWVGFFHCRNSELDERLLDPELLIPKP